MLQIRDITKTYQSGDNKIVALDHISIDFPDKGLIFIVGKSGAGKSTLLNILGGLDIMDDGEVFFDGKSTANYSSKDFDYLRNYKIGFVFQEFNLLEDSSVYDNIAVSLKMQAKGHDATTIDEALKLVNLEGLGYRKISELSGGQKQRIAIARALVKNPDIILADEPTGALDSKTGFELVASLKNLSEQKLVIIVSHDYEMAYYYADRIIHLNDGKIVKQEIRKVKNKDENIVKYGDNLLKITSGNFFDSPEAFNNLLDEDKDNLICMTAVPETMTVAKPELYDEIFKVEDYRLQFDEYKEANQKIDVKDEKEEKKAKLRFKECLKMALNSYSRSIGRIIFLLLFTIISIALLGTCLSLAITSNNKIIANTLLNNDISLGMMQKTDNSEFNELDISNLDETYPESSFALAKTMEINYDQSINANSSAFAMKSFTGIIECNDLKTLNLDIIVGKSAFDDNSLANGEIIISDYAAYELQRTGYLGSDINGYYSLNKPTCNEDIIGTSISLRSKSYKIVGIFDTNYEKYLSLLVDSTYNSDESVKDTNSLAALKNYYYARIFAPKGFYRQMYYENSTDAEKELYSIYSKTVEIYNSSIEDYAVSNKNVSYSNVIDFNTFDYNQSEYNVIYDNGITLNSNLKDNQIILNSELLQNYNVDITDSEQVQRFVDTLKTLYVAKVDGLLNPITTVYQQTFDVVGIVSFTNPEKVMMFFSPETKDRLESTKFNYNQVFFSLSGGIYSYTSKISKLNKNEYKVLNIDGSSSFTSSSLDSIKSFALIISCIFIIFSFLIVLNFVSGNVKARKKEIGILRATGARKKDILNIFAVEEGILTIIIAIISSIIVIALSNFINSVYGNVDIGLEIIIFDFVNILIIFAITGALMGIATIIPVLSIASLKPIEAIRNI